MSSVTYVKLNICQFATGKVHATINEKVDNTQLGDLPGSPF